MGRNHTILNCSFSQNIIEIEQTLNRNGNNCRTSTITMHQTWNVKAPVAHQRLWQSSDKIEFFHSTKFICLESGLACALRHREIILVCNGAQISSLDWLYKWNIVDCSTWIIAVSEAVYSGKVLQFDCLPKLLINRHCLEWWNRQKKFNRQNNNLWHMIWLVI